MASTEMIQLSPSLPHPKPATPPSSPNPSSAEHIVTLKNAYQLIDMVRGIVAMEIASTSAVKPEPARPASAPGTTQTEELVAKAAKLEYKTVNEVWDEKIYKYKVVESTKSLGEVNELDKYVFVVRRRIDKKTMDTTFYVDVKSEWLRDVMRAVLKDFRGIDQRKGG